MWHKMSDSVELFRWAWFELKNSAGTNVFFVDFYNYFIIAFDYTCECTAKSTLNY